MGFFSKIGNFLSKASNVVSQVTNFADKALSFVKAPLDTITKPLTGVLEKVADKLPFGIGKLVKPYIGKFMDSAVSWLAGGPLGGFFGLLQKAAPTIQKINDILHTVDDALKGGIKSLPEQARDNIVNGTAWQIAQTLVA